MKKIIALALALVFICLLAACGGGEQGKNELVGYYEALSYEGENADLLNQILESSGLTVSLTVNDDLSGKWDSGPYVSSSIKFDPAAGTVTVGAVTGGVSGVASIVQDDSETICTYTFDGKTLRITTQEGTTTVFEKKN